MKKVTHLDVLVVYSAYAATSASSMKPGSETPFSLSSTRSDYDNSYAYLLKTCKKKGINAAFTTSADITGPGQCSNYWLHNRQGWHKKQQIGVSQIIFDKFSPFNYRQKKQRDLMFSSLDVRPFNEPKLYHLFFDKYSTYKTLSSIAIPTAIIEDSTLKNIKQSIKNLSNLLKLHKNQSDFSSEYVLKDRFGSAGQHVHRIQSDYVQKIQTIMRSKPKVSFILQPVVKFDQGFSYKGITGRIELRLIFMGNKILQTYIRIAPSDGFLCNDHQGGTSIYIKVTDIPLKILNLASKVIPRLPAHNSLYALDFLLSNNGNPYLLEGNTGPGLNWDPSKKIDEKKSHQLIQAIVEELDRRVKGKATAGNKLSFSPKVISFINP